MIKEKPVLFGLFFQMAILCFAAFLFAPTARLLRLRPPTGPSPDTTGSTRRGRCGHKHSNSNF